MSENQAQSGQGTTDTGLPAGTDSAAAAAAQASAQASSTPSDAGSAGTNPDAEGGKGASEGVDGKGPDDKGGEKPQGAPEKYEPFKSADGEVLQGEVFEKFQAVAKELNLTQEQAQKLAELGPQLTKANADQLKATVEKAREEWATATKSDKEIGGDKLQENLGVAKKALDSFGTPELRTLLEDSGLGNHPEVIRLMTRVGKAISEDKVLVGGKQSAGNLPLEKKLYPNNA